MDFKGQWANCYALLRKNVSRRIQPGTTSAAWRYASLPSKAPTLGNQSGPELSELGWRTLPPNLAHWDSGHAVAQAFQPAVSPTFQSGRLPLPGGSPAG